MKIVSIISGKATWLFETAELNPRGLDLHPIYVAVRNKYAFSTPKTREEIDDPKDGVKFLNGSFKVDGADSFSVNLAIYNDGLVAETRASSGHSEAFLTDVVTFAKKQHGLYFEPTMIRQRRFGSKVVFESESGLHKLSDLMSGVNATLKAETGRGFEASGLTLAFDPTEPNDALSPFLIERRANLPLSANRFYSSAPVSTEAHIAILEQVEKLMA